MLTEIQLRFNRAIMLSGRASGGARPLKERIYFATESGRRLKQTELISLNLAI